MNSVIIQCVESESLLVEDCKNNISISEWEKVCSAMKRNSIWKALMVSIVIIMIHGKSLDRTPRDNVEVVQL